MSGSGILDTVVEARTGTDSDPPVALRRAHSLLGVTLGALHRLEALGNMAMACHVAGHWTESLTKRYKITSGGSNTTIQASDSAVKHIVRDLTREKDRAVKATTPRSVSSGSFRPSSFPPRGRGRGSYRDQGFSNPGRMGQRGSQGHPRV